MVKLGQTTRGTKRQEKEVSTVETSEHEEATEETEEHEEATEETEEHEEATEESSEETEEHEEATEESSEETEEHEEAIIKPEWHHVSLNTIANLDIDILDEKRQLYLKLYRELKELIRDLHKCKSGHSYERRLAKMYIRNDELLDENRVSHDYINYVSRKISMCNVECGLWTSKVEEATGLHESRRYSRPTLKY